MNVTSRAPVTSLPAPPLRRMPVRSMPREKSAAIARAPSVVKASVEVPVPAPRSSTSSPGPASTAAAVALRQSRS